MTTRKSVWLVMEDDATAQRLVELVGKHSKLALEHNSKNIRPERRKAIKAEIESLRMMRDAIITQHARKGGDELEEGI